jgi:hypothetical protein
MIQHYFYINCHHGFPRRDISFVVILLISVLRQAVTYRIKGDHTLNREIFPDRNVLLKKYIKGQLE